MESKAVKNMETENLQQLYATLAIFIEVLIPETEEEEKRFNAYIQLSYAIRKELEFRKVI